jgi:hypothetical protein
MVKKKKKKGKALDDKEVVWEEQITEMILSAGCQWLMPVILATQDRDQEDRCFKPAQANSLWDSL